MAAAAPSGDTRGSDRHPATALSTPCLSPRAPPVPRPSPRAPPAGRTPTPRRASPARATPRPMWCAGARSAAHWCPSSCWCAVRPRRVRWGGGRAGHRDGRVPRPAAPGGAHPAGPERRRGRYGAGGRRGRKHRGEPHREEEGRGPAERGERRVGRRRRGRHRRRWRPGFPGGGAAPGAACPYGFGGAPRGSRQQGGTARQGRVRPAARAASAVSAPGCAGGTGGGPGAGPGRGRRPGRRYEAELGGTGRGVAKDDPSERP